MAGNARSRHPLSTVMAMAERFRRESPSRELDGAISCALYDLRDRNNLAYENMQAAGPRVRC